MHRALRFEEREKASATKPLHYQIISFDQHMSAMNFTAHCLQCAPYNCCCHADLAASTINAKQY